jgi:hypothetical protein
MIDMQDSLCRLRQTMNLAWAEYDQKRDASWDEYRAAGYPFPAHRDMARRDHAALYQRYLDARAALHERLATIKGMEWT